MIKVLGFNQEWKTFDGGDWPVTEYVYLCGEVADENDFDLCYVSALPEEAGIYPVTITTSKGKEYEGKFFFWRKYKLPRGLIVKNGDTEGMQEAKRRFDRKETAL